MNALKVIILYNKLFHYRLPVWNCLAEKCDLTVAYTYGDGSVPVGVECKFKRLHLPAKKYFGRFVIHKDNIRKLVKDYDVVVIYSDISWLKYSTLPFFNNKKVVIHTIGVSASYDKGYDEHKEWDYVRKFFYNKADSLAFYTYYPIEKYAKMGVKREKMFVAINTVAVSQIPKKMEKDSILMIGTLYRQKGIQYLLDAYLKLRNVCDLPVLNIVGKGPDEQVIKAWIDEHGMEDLVKMRGAIYDIEEKSRYFGRAFACISPMQAGLTVLESMGYGVPFVTTKNAITGGEIFNIHNGIDGVVMENVNELVDVIKDICVNNEKYIEMGKSAKNYYNNNCTPEHMAMGLWNAICYACKQ